MSKIFLQIAILTLSVYSQTSVEQLQKIVASNREEGDHFGYPVSISGDYLVVSTPDENHDENDQNELDYAGSAFIFEKQTNGTWEEVQKIVSSDREERDRFGNSVSISGDYATVGASREDHDENGQNELDDAGSVYIFERHTDGTWIEVQKIVARDREADDWFGHSVSISGDYLVVGAFHEDHDENGQNEVVNAGSAYIFERHTDGTWVEVQKIVATDREVSDWFGYSVSISGDYLVVGTFHENHDENGQNELEKAGSAYIFERQTDGTWVEVQKIVAIDREAGDWFGYSVSISGDYLVVGALHENHDENDQNELFRSGSAYVYERQTNGTWEEVQKIVASDREEGDWFGSSVSISGDYLVVGAGSESHDENGQNELFRSGSAYVYERQTNGTWEEVQKIVASDREEGDWFGSSVSISGDYATVGASREDHDENGQNELEEAGSAYIFEIKTASSVEKEQVNNNSSVGIYPNPARDFIQLKDIKNNTLVEITDNSGNTFEARYNSGIDISRVGSGMYFVKYQNTNGEFVTSKFIKE